MAHFMQPALLALFTPRDALEHKPPIEKRKMPPYTGVADFLKYCSIKRDVPPRVKNETPTERRERRKKQKAERAKKRIEMQLKKWNPNKDTNVKSDAYKTLFVGRLSYQVDAQDLKDEFGHYGDVKSMAIVKKKDGTPRGYAFVEFKHSSDLKAAYRRADGRKLRGRRILVDVERGRTVEKWKPRKLGGGLGGTRKGGESMNIKTSGREGSTREDRDSRSGRGGDRDGPSSRGGDRDSYRSSRDDRGGGGRDRDRDHRSSRSSRDHRSSRHDRDRDHHRTKKSSSEHVTKREADDKVVHRRR